MHVLSSSSREREIDFTRPYFTFNRNNYDPKTKTAPMSKQMRSLRLFLFPTRAMESLNRFKSIDFCFAL